MADGLHDRNYRYMIVKLGDDLHPDDLSKMIFYCRKEIPGSLRDKIKTFLQLVEKLEERKKVSAQNVDFLKSMVKACTSGRQDIFEAIDTYDKNNDEMMDATPESNSRKNYWNPALAEPIDFLKNRLGKDRRWFFRALGFDDAELENLEEEHPRDVKEQIFRAFKIYGNRRRELMCVQDFIDACEKIRRRDLVRKLEQNDFS